MHKINLAPPPEKKDFWYYFDKFEEIDRNFLNGYYTFTNNLPESLLWFIQGKYKEKIKQKELSSKL